MAGWQDGMMVLPQFPLCAWHHGHHWSRIHWLFKGPFFSRKRKTMHYHHQHWSFCCLTNERLNFNETWKTKQSKFRNRLKHLEESPLNPGRCVFWNAPNSSCLNPKKTSSAATAILRRAFLASMMNQLVSPLVPIAKRNPPERRWWFFAFFFFTLPTNSKRGIPPPTKMAESSPPSPSPRWTAQTSKTHFGQFTFSGHLSQWSGAAIY